MELDMAWKQSATRSNKKQKYYSLPVNQLPKKLIRVFSSYERTRKAQKPSCNIKELRNRNHYFSFRYKNRWKHDQYSKQLFCQNYFTLWRIRLNMYIWEANFSSHTQYLCGLVFSRNAKKTHTAQNIL